METTINSRLGGLALGLLLRMDLKPGLDVVEPFADLGDGLLLVPVYPDAGDDLWLGLVAVGLVAKFGEDLLFTSVEFD